MKLGGGIRSGSRRAAKPEPTPRINLSWSAAARVSGSLPFAIQGAALAGSNSSPGRESRTDSTSQLPVRRTCGGHLPGRFLQSMRQPLPAEQPMVTFWELSSLRYAARHSVVFRMSHTPFESQPCNESKLIAAVWCAGSPGVRICVVFEGAGVVEKPPNHRQARDFIQRHAGHSDCGGMDGAGPDGPG